MEATKTINKVEGLMVRIRKKSTEYIKVYIRNMRKIIRLLPDAVIEYIFKNFFEVEVSINKTLVLSFILIIS